MTQYYHYATWNGSAIHFSGKIKPSTRYVGQVCGPTAPPLVFLTTNDYWEPSVQALSKKTPYVRGPSTPERYAAEHIPLWRFTVEIKAPINVIYNVPGFISMLHETKLLGSDMSQWHWTTETLDVLTVAKFEGETSAWVDSTPPQHSVVI